MAFNYNPGATYSTAAEGSSRLDAYSYYYQNMSLPPNSSQEAPYYAIDTNAAQVPPRNIHNFYGNSPYSYATGQDYQSGNTSSVVPVPTPKTVGGRSRSPVERVLRYRLDDNEVSSSLMSAKHSGKRSNAGRQNKRSLSDNRNGGYNPFNPGFTNNSSINEALLVSNAEERRSIELQLNEAMFFDRLFEVNFTSSWYKLKKKDEDGTELVCVVIEIIDCHKKVYKVYGGYTSNIRAKEMAFGQAIKKLNAIIEEQEKEKLEQAKQLITSAVVSNTNMSTLPFTSGHLLVRNPLFNSSTCSVAANASIYGQSLQPVPPGTENVTSEYDPVNYSYDYHYRQQPLPPGTEKNFSEESTGNQQQMASGNSLQQNQQQQQHSTDSSSTIRNIDRPCAGRGDFEDKFTKKAKETGYSFRCLQLHPKKYFNTEYFVFELQLGKPNEPPSKITGTSLRDEGQARECVYAMALDKLEKVGKKQTEKTNNPIDYECEWITPVPSSLSLHKSSSSNQKPDTSSDYPVAPLRKIIQAPNWDWQSTSDDLSILKCVPTFSMGRGKPKNTGSITSPGGDILDHREWRWPAC